MLDFHHRCSPAQSRLGEIATYSIRERMRMGEGTPAQTLSQPHRLADAVSWRSNLAKARLRGIAQPQSGRVRGDIGEARKLCLAPPGRFAPNSQQALTGSTAVRPMTFIEKAGRSNNRAQILGMAAIVGLAYRQSNLTAVWSELVERFTADPKDAAALMDMAIVLLTTGNRGKGLELQQMALQISRCYDRAFGSGDGLKVVAFVAEGDFMSNTPVDFLMEGSHAVLSFYYIDESTPDLQDVPEHDVAFIAIGESEANSAVLANLERLLDGWHGPIMNGPPRRIAALTRDGVADMLAGETALITPVTRQADRVSLERLARGQIEAAALLPDGAFPITVRPYGSHGGRGLEKMESPAEIAAYLERQDEQQFYVAPFLNYAGPDGFFRKQRIAVIDGRPYASHLAISSDWVVHYLSSGMQENASWRAEEAAWMADFDHDFAVHHAPAFDALYRKLGLDYFVIDCAEMPDGRLLLFEAQVAMIVHAMDADGVFSYKRPAMRKLFGAFHSALKRRRRPLS